jgi:hypothetical protein
MLLGSIHGQKPLRGPWPDAPPLNTPLPCSIVVWFSYHSFVFLLLALTDIVLFSRAGHGPVHIFCYFCKALSPGLGQLGSEPRSLIH